MSKTFAPAARYAAAAPLAACRAYGLGPFPRITAGSPSEVLDKLRESADGVMTAAQSVGRTGQQLLNLLVWAGGSISSECLAFETQGIDPAELAAANQRLADAGLAAADGTGGLRLKRAVAGMFAPIGLSLHDQHAVTADAIERICHAVSEDKIPSRKQDRINTVEARFADPASRPAIMAKLSREAYKLLDAIADRAGPRLISADAVGISGYNLRQAESSRYGVQPRETERTPLAELTRLGIVGVNAYEGCVWIWREAWPLLDRPLYRAWPTVPAPDTGAVTETGLRLPSLVALFERALRHWDANPPPVLKGGDLRLSKPLVRATAKALSSDEATIGLIADTALSLGLMLPNVVSVSGRGRNRRTEQAWMADDDLRSAWSAAPAPVRWLRLFAEWASPAGSPYQLVANRHLVLWELAALPPGLGWVDDDQAARWIEHHHASVGVAIAVTDTLADLRRLGVVSPSGPAGLTDLGRLALVDPGAVAKADFGSAGSAIVQADHTVVCPPDLAPELVERLEQISRLESDSGARVFRLDGPMITSAVQNGASADGLATFLESLSSVPLADTVRRLVADAAARADRVRVVSANTVVVFADPVDLVMACKIASAKLVELTTTVAVSNLPADKVHVALARKGLAPVAVSSGSEVTARRSSDEATQYEQAARRHEDLATRYENRSYREEAERLRAAAEAARNPASRVAVVGPIAATPALIEAVG